MSEAVMELKGASGLVGAGRIHYTCYYIEQAYRDNKVFKLQDYHPLLIEEYIRFYQQVTKLPDSFSGK